MENPLFTKSQHGALCMRYAFFWLALQPKFQHSKIKVFFLCKIYSNQFKGNMWRNISLKTTLTYTSTELRLCPFTMFYLGKIVKHWSFWLSVSYLDQITFFYRKLYRKPRKIRKKNRDCLFNSFHCKIERSIGLSVFQYWGSSNNEWTVLPTLQVLLKLKLCFYGNNENDSFLTFQWRYFSSRFLYHAEISQVFLMVQSTWLL